jgi:glyoxylate/hydroxypyruvate reductase A
MSEYVITAIMGHLKNMHQYTLDKLSVQWAPRPYSRISDHLVGIMGMGTLGTHLAKSLQNCGFKVSGWSRNEKNFPGAQTFHGYSSRKEFLNGVSILVCLLPLTPETERILNAETLSELPRGAFLINVARGGHLAEAELIPLLDKGQLSGACLDVFEQEPLPNDHPFWKHPLIQITPHVASVSDPASVVAQLAENFLRLGKGEKLLHQVDLLRGY